MHIGLVFEGLFCGDVVTVATSELEVVESNCFGFGEVKVELCMFLKMVCIGVLSPFGEIKAHKMTKT